MQNVQIFGVKNSAPTRAALRFFKERRIPVQFVDLKQKPMAPGEIRRFIEKFTLPGLIDVESKPYVSGGLQYLRLTEAQWLERIAAEPGLLRLPLVRLGKLLSAGADPAAWKAMSEAAAER